MVLPVCRSRPWYSGCEYLESQALDGVMLDGSMLHEEFLESPAGNSDFAEAEAGIEAFANSSS